MVCKCSLVEQLDLLPIAVLLMIGGKLPARRAKSAHFLRKSSPVAVTETERRGKKSSKEV
jgi:hypothetical protein